MNSSPISRWPDDPGSHIAFPDRPPRLFPDRGSRRRNAVNRLLCALAVAGIGGACWGFWLEYDEHRDVAASREKIVSACGGLVEPDAVLRLNGGIHRVKPSSDADDTIDSEQQTGSCVIYRVGEPGTTYAHFALTVVPQPSDGYANIVSGSSKNPFDRRDRPRDEALVARADEALPHPLGDGRLGHYDDSTATAKAVCANPARTKGRITSVKALAAGSRTMEDADVHRGGPQGAGRYRPPRRATGLRTGWAARRRCPRSRSGGSGRGAARQGGVGLRDLRLVRAVHRKGARRAARPGPRCAGRLRELAGSLPACGQCRRDPQDLAARTRTACSRTSASPTCCGSRGGG